MPVEMAEGLLQILRSRLEGSTLCDLLNSQIYTKYGLLSDEPSTSSSSRSHSCTPDPQEESKSEASFSEEEPECPGAKTKPSEAEAEPAKARTELPMAQSDLELFNKLLAAEGMAIPPKMKEAASGESQSGSREQRHVLGGPIEGMDLQGGGKPCSKLLPSSL